MLLLKTRKGIAMIELIFAIVVMSFVMLSLPLIVNQVKQSQHLGLKQESIALIASQVNLILTHQWDDTQTRGNNHSFILKTNSGKASREYNPTTKLKGNRKKFINSRLYSSEDLFASDTLKLETDKTATNLDDDIDDFNGRTMTLSIEGTEKSSEKEYIDQTIDIDTTVSYSNYNGDLSAFNINIVNGGVSGTSTNVKSVESVLTSSHARTGDTKITLKGFAANIGGYNTEVVGGF